jgi:hypothetical protein
VHGIDARVLGDSEDANLPEALRGSFQEPRFQVSLPTNQEVLELQARNAAWAPSASPDQMVTDSDEQSSNLPSWESFLGGVADLLYHAPHVKADYSPFLAHCLGSADALWRFYEALYFGTVPEALAEMRIDDETRPLAAIRSLAYQPPGHGPMLRRAMGKCTDGRKPVTVTAAPIDRFLKARGFDVPRTWISGLSEKLRQHGAGQFVCAAKDFFRESVGNSLVDPKKADPTGDIFAAWLRACHRQVWDDIDHTDATKLQRKGVARSKADPSRQYNLKDIQPPEVEQAFAEITAQKPLGQPFSTRQQIISKVLVDPFGLRSVDLAMILKVGTIVKSAPAKSQVVVVLYAGSDHTNSVTKFWRSWGFSHAGLPKKGKVGKGDYKDGETRGLSLPSYLHDIDKLFPVPASIKDTSMRMTEAQSRHNAK